MTYRLNWLTRATLLSLLLLSCGCVVDRPVVAPQAPRPQIPAPLNQDPPPPGIFQKCLKELEQGQTSGPACSALPSPASS